MTKRVITYYSTDDSIIVKDYGVNNLSMNKNSDGVFIFKDYEIRNLIINDKTLFPTENPNWKTILGETEIKKIQEKKAVVDDTSFKFTHVINDITDTIELDYLGHVTSLSQITCKV